LTLFGHLFLSFPNGSMLIAGGADAKLQTFDVISGGGKSMTQISNHQKSITCLCFNHDCTKLLSASLDQHVKIYDLRDYSVVHSIKYNAPILATAISPDNTHLVTGMTDSVLSIRHKVINKTDYVQMEKESQTKLTRASYRYFVRGKDTIPSPNDFVVERFRKTKLKGYDEFLRKFEYSKALDAALRKPIPIVVYSVLEELINRGGLHVALSNRDDEALLPILRFITKHISIPKFAELLVYVTQVILDIYDYVVSTSELVLDLLNRLKTKLAQEIRYQKRLLEMMGTLEFFVGTNV